MGGALGPPLELRREVLRVCAEGQQCPVSSPGVHSGRAEPSPHHSHCSSHLVSEPGRDCGALWAALPSPPAVCKHPHPPFTSGSVCTISIRPASCLGSCFLQILSPWEELWVPGMKSVRVLDRKRTASHIHLHPSHMLCDDVHQTQNV